LKNRNRRYQIRYSFNFLTVIIFAAAVSLVVTGAFSTLPAEAQKGNWKYIVIHHSATDDGNAEIFDKCHKKRGMENGLAYHFVINNGRSGTEDGQIQTGRRWKRQIEGGHVRQRWLNIEGIGICVVGNLNNHKMTKKQYWSLVWLTRDLMEKCNIPSQNVLFHGKIKGEKTECPGTYFPYKGFMRNIKSGKKR